MKVSAATAREITVTIVGADHISDSELTRVLAEALFAARVEAIITHRQRYAGVRVTPELEADE